MKLSRNERLIIAIGVCILIFFINIMYVVNPLIDKVVDAKKTFNSNENKINDLTKLEQEKEERKKREKFFKYELELITQKLPNNIVPETFVSQIRNFVYQFGISAEKITFTTPQVIGINGVSPIAAEADMIQKANNAIYNLFMDTELEKTKVSDKVLQFTEIEEDSVIRVDVKFNFSGQYENIKNFVSFIESENRDDPDHSKNIMIIKDIEFTASTDGAQASGELNGSMTLSFFGIKDSSIPIYKLWDKEINRGKTNFFSFEGSERFDIESASMSDFDVQLHPVTSDYPSVIIGKHGVYGSKIYGDNLANEVVTIEFRGDNGQYQYRYKSQSITYPLNNGWAPFEARTPKDIIIKVYSTPRVNDKDTSGIDLRIINKTDRKVQVLNYNDDEVRPRLKYRVQ